MWYANDPFCINCSFFLQILFVHAGALLGESEELIDGYVVHNNQDGIQASWAAVDLESDVREYLVGIGTAKGIHNLPIVLFLFPSEVQVFLT